MILLVLKELNAACFYNYILLNDVSQLPVMHYHYKYYFPFSLFSSGMWCCQIAVCVVYV